MTVRFETVTAFTARDEYEQSAGALTGKTAPVGGTWVGAGDADDFSIETTLDVAIRSPAADTGTDERNGRLATLGSSITSSFVQADFYRGTGQSPFMGVILRYADVNNWLIARTHFDGTTHYIALKKCVAGTVTEIVLEPLSYALENNRWYTMRLRVDSGGRVAVWLFPQGAAFVGSPLIVQFDIVLATAGALASGKAGILHWAPLGALGEGRFDNFVFAAATPDAACFAGRRLEIRHDRAERENAAGTTWNRVTSRRGRYLRFAPGGQEGRSNRFFLKAVRGPEIQTNVWADPSIDDIAVDLYATPLGVAVPEP